MNDMTLGGGAQPLDRQSLDTIWESLARGRVSEELAIQGKAGQVGVEYLDAKRRDLVIDVIHACNALSPSQGDTFKKLAYLTTTLGVVQVLLPLSYGPDGVEARKISEARMIIGRMGSRDLIPQAYYSSERSSLVCDSIVSLMESLKAIEGGNSGEADEKFTQACQLLKQAFQHTLAKE
jgi:hypothetical protein